MRRVVGQIERAQNRERLRGKGLVEFDHAEIADLEPELFHQPDGRRHRAIAHDARRQRGGGEPLDARERL